jgi:hypothetical protein
LAVAALTTAGYAGMLTGPAAIGFLSKGIGLHSVLVSGRSPGVCADLRQTCDGRKFSLIQRAG